jgi:MATE family multidrug resistance protein
VDNINEFNELSGLSLLGSVGEEVDVGEEVIDVDDKVSLKDKVWIEMKKMWIVAGLAMFTKLSTFGLNVVTQAFVGHIGSIE